MPDIIHQIKNAFILLFKTTGTKIAEAFIKVSKINNMMFSPRKISENN